MKSSTLAIDRVACFLNWIVEDCSGAGWVFRGQADAEWRLFPSVARNDPKVNPVDAQRRVLKELKLRLPSVYQGDLSDEWEVLALAQHHGAPTALLDWSRSPLTALWFAVSERARLNNVSDAAVWAFSTLESDFVGESEKKKLSPIDVEETRFFEVRHFDRRLAAQQGLFSVHKWWQRGGKVVPLDGHKNLKKRLKKMVVPKEKISSLLRELDTLGVNAASVFPDLEGICKHTLIKYRLDPAYVFLEASASIPSITVNGKIG